MSNEKMREDFEEYAKSIDHNVSRDKLGRYVFAYTATMWVGWKKSWIKSREALIVPLPTGVTTRQALDMGYSGDYAAGMDDGIEECEKSLISAGITVKHP